MKEEEMQAILQGLLYVCGDAGVKIEDTARTLDITEEEAKAQLNTLSNWVDSHLGGLQVKRTGDTYRLLTREQVAPYIEKLMEVPDKGTLSQAALETLAIIAYNQPVTRAEIDDIRGVKSERAIQTLMNKELVEEAGRAKSTGRPILYQTTERFLEYFNMTSLEELPAFDLPIVEEASEEKEADLFFESLDEDK